MKDLVLNTIRKYNLIENGDKIVLGVSGGPDSISMLDILNAIKQEKIFDFEIIVAHINHGLRKEAIDDEKYVQEYCNKNQIKYYIKRIDIKQYANNNKIGTEEAGRKARYDFFDEILEKEKANKISIAHNKNDKIETIIMNEIRGTGLAGLKGIEPIRDNKFIRPLIECTREQIEKYCEEKKLNPRIDKTNFINDCTRNKIRNIVLPYIKKEFNPNIIETINRLSEVIGETEDYMEKKTLEEYNKIKIDNNSLDLKKFNKLDELMQKRIIFLAIKNTIGNTQNIEKVNIEDIIKLCNNNIGNKYLTPNKEIKVKINKGKIFFESLK